MKTKTCFNPSPYLRTSTKIIFIFISLLFVFSSCCKDDDPTTEVVQEQDEQEEIINECTNGELHFYDILSTLSINCFDYQIGSPYQNQVFSTLAMRQDRFETCVDGQYTLNGYAENIITFKNITAYTISFDYLITQNHSGQIRTHQGYIANLGPNEEHINNTGNNTFYNLNNSQVTVQMSNITYN